ncbi:MAG TPA: TonB-dependent receptor [Cyclobacteriaceae bacterium]|nr:TonB-dependent receptor [Cyclobacteriaceae bacterium]
MQKVLRLTMGVLLLLFTSAAWAQTRTVSGKVSSKEDGTSLPGVNVLVKGTSNGTTTDADGKYSLSVPDAGGTLVFSFIGLASQEIEIGQQTIIDISMAADATQLSEVVVVGYGTQSKRDINGAIATVDGDKIKAMPNQSFEQALGGRAAGVQVSIPNGVLNNPPVIRVRGVNSINLSSFPLVVIDGIPAFTGDNSATNSPNNPLANINPSDIESVEVLKDASASAIYGSRAASGVILVTTKRGTKGSSKFQYDAWVGVTQPFRLFKMLNADQYMTMKNEAVVNLNQNTLAATGTYGTATEGSFRPSLDANGNPINTNWYDHVYRTGFSHFNSISFSGATDKTSHYVSVGYTGQKGMLKKNDFDRTSVRINIDHKVYKNFTVGATINYANNFNSAPSTGSLPGAAFNTAGLGRLPLVLPPNVAAFNPDGSYNLGSGGLGAGANINPTSPTQAPLLPGYYNPDLILDKDKYTSEGNELQGNIYAAWQVIPGLTVKTLYGVNRSSFEDQVFQNSLGGDGYSNGGLAANFYRTNKRWNWQNTIQYDKSIGKNNLSVLVGGEQQYTQVSRWGAQRTALADPFFTSFQGNYTNIAVSGLLQSENYLVSYFGRVNYDYDKKYFVSLNARRDGYSAWANKWGNFYGAAVGYAISEEGFWKNNSFLSNINFFKIKGSYGEVGNSNGIGDFASLQLYSSGLYGAAATLGYSQAGNTALTWEKSKKTDIGFTYGILNDKIQGEFSYYKNLVDGLILNVPQAPSKGVPGNSLPANVGSMQNTGIEITIKYNAINRSDFRWTVGANVTTSTNKVLTLNSDNALIGNTTLGLETVNYVKVGQSVGAFLAVPTLGVNQANGRRLFQKIDGTVVQYDHLGTGWTDLNGNTVTAASQANDGRFYGPALPKWYGGIDNTFSYKNFDLGIFFQYSGGNYVYNGTKAGLRDQRFWNNHTDVLDRWTPEHPSGKIPRVVYGDNVSNGSAIVISENIEKGDFLRLKNVQIGYTFNKGLLEKVKISNARIYASVQNAFIITKYKGIDPENNANGNSPSGASVDRNSVGQARTYTVGINVTF